MINSEGTQNELKSDSSSTSYIQQEDNPNMNPVEIAPESDIDYSVEVKHCDSSISEKDYETLNMSSEKSECEILLNESSSNSDVNEGRTFQQRCINELKQSDLLDNLITKLDETQNLQDFMT